MTIVYDPLEIPFYQTGQNLLITQARANAYVVGTTPPRWLRRGMLWSDTSVSPPVLRVLTDDGWADIEAVYNTWTYVDRIAHASITSTGNTIAKDFGALAANKNAILEIVMASSGTGYGRVGLRANSSVILNDATSDSTCLGYDATALRGAAIYVHIPRRDQEFNAAMGTARSAVNGTGIVRVVGASNAMPSGDWSKLELLGAVSAASTTVLIAASLYTY